MDPELKAMFMAAVNRFAATRVRLVLAENADAVSTAPSPYAASVEREKELAAHQEAYIEKMLDDLVA